MTDTHAVPVKVRDLKAGMRIRCADGVYRTISEDSVVDSLATRHATTWNAGRAVDAEVRLLMTDGTWATVTVSGHVYGVAVVLFDDDTHTCQPDPDGVTA